MENTFILRTALKANGFFSLLSAVTSMIFGNSFLAISEMVHNKPLSFAIQMLIFGSVVLFAAYRNKVSRILVWIIIAMDLLFVLTELSNLLFAENISSGGIAVIVLTNILVLIFAIFQTKGILIYSKSIKK